ncbi:MAG TPA: choice-of-anchor Q domain-containing protein [Dokdonella sp.]|uniref:choice-of-anchor Q domain-containing protein n=1 Tax=Dokdonella sp. TaxID=2291710 RepID=UPI002D7F784A|nr:choice-of-anchor Q domain-containing protein [Dokdonella sp.]HET9031981.1 choice-of-anchor Q domain-containing protein [Dokdonella sp.]
MHNRSAFSIVSALCLLLVSLSAHAVDFSPNSTVDLPDFNPGDGSCQTAPTNPECTLRAAIMEANALAGADRILLSGGTYTLTIGGTDEDGAETGDLDITDDLSILSAPGVLTTINAGALDRVFDVQGSADTTFSGLIISGGDATISASAAYGGGIRSGSTGTVLLQFCKLEFNRADAGGGLWKFGGPVEIHYSSLHGNQAIAGSTNPEGAAIRVEGGLLRIENSSIYNNSTVGNTGNIGSISAKNGDIRIFSTTISGDNTFGINAYRSSLLLQNVTVTRNVRQGLAWTTINGESRGLFIRNSIIADNDANNGFEPDCLLNSKPGDTVDIDGHNLSGDNSCGFAASSGNLVATDPLLEPLNTSLLLPVHLPSGNSPVIDAGSPLDPTSGNPEACFQFDQLGRERETGRCDIGAVERLLLFRDGFDP